MALKPLHDLVYVKLTETPAETASGIYLQQHTETNIGTVVAVGPGRTYETGDIIPVDLAIGDKVLFSPHAGQKFEVDGEYLFALRESQILAVIG